MLLRRLARHFKQQEWTALFLDFVVVVVGILLALQITEWNDARQDRLREHGYLVRIGDELDQSIRDIEASLALARERQQTGQFLIQSIGQPALVRAEPARFLTALHKGAYTYSAEIRSHTFDEIKAVGDLDVLRDKPLLLELTEFFTSVRESAQWNYLRELKQTEYMRRAAGILSFEDILKVEGPDPNLAISAADALAAHARMLERPAFIEWLPTVAMRKDDIDIYLDWQERALRLRAKIAAATRGGSETR